MSLSLRHTFNHSLPFAFGFFPSENSRKKPTQKLLFRFFEKAERLLFSFPSFSFLLYQGLHALMIRVLLSNDDGVEALGLRELYAVLQRMGTCHGRRLDVRVSAPATNQSAMSHKLTMGGPLTARRCHDPAYTRASSAASAANATGDENEPWVIAVTGTPVDSVRVGLALLEQPGSDGAGPWVPDIVLAGVNHGNNLGLCALYSGTVAAAVEGTLHGAPGVALSYDMRALDEFDARDQRDMAAAIAAAVPPLLAACFDAATGRCRIPPAHTLVVNIPNPLQVARAAAASPASRFRLTRLSPTSLLTPYSFTPRPDAPDCLDVGFCQSQLQDVSALLQSGDVSVPPLLAQYPADIEAVKKDGCVSVALLPLVPACDVAAAYEHLATTWTLFA